MDTTVAQWESSVNTIPKLPMGYKSPTARALLHNKPIFQTLSQKSPKHLKYSIHLLTIVVCKLAERSIGRGSESDAVVVPSGQNQKCKQPSVCHDFAEKYTSVCIGILRWLHPL